MFMGGFAVVDGADAANCLPRSQASRVQDQHKKEGQWACAWFRSIMITLNRVRGSRHYCKGHSLLCAQLSSRHQEKIAVSPC